MKIHIIGCSGSGKTYFAKKLSDKYAIPHFDLDNIQWDNTAEGYGVKMPADRRAALLKNMLQNESWIIEGVYYSWVSDCFRDADLIYLLQTPKPVYTARIVKRFIKRKLGLEKGKKETLKSVYHLLKWTDTWQKQNLPEILKVLAQYGHKTVVLRSKKEVDRIIATGLQRKSISWDSPRNAPQD